MFLFTNVTNKGEGLLQAMKRKFILKPNAPASLFFSGLKVRKKRFTLVMRENIYTFKLLLSGKVE